MSLDLDIIIPVYNEGENIVEVLESLRAHVKHSYRVLICYDQDEDTTLTALANYKEREHEIVLVKNSGQGAHTAVCTGFAVSAAPAILVFPADDTYNAPILDRMVEEFRRGSDIVCASRFIPGGSMEGCPWIKFILVRIAAFTLRYLAFLPTHDATNGFRLFSRRVLQQISIESSEGFTYSIELLVKCARLRWKISEVPARWFQRTKGTSRFRVWKWAIPYLRWYAYGFETAYLRRGPDTVILRS